MLIFNTFEIEPGPQCLVRRIGAFSVSLTLIRRHADALRAAFEGCVITRAEAVYHMNRIDYVGMHADFDEAPLHETPPNYICEMTVTPDGVTRRWRRADG